MSPSLSLSAVTAAMLAVLAIAVRAFDDRHTTVPPPEVVAENFVRQLNGHRFRQTKRFFSSSLQRSWNPQELQRWWSEIESQVGEVQTIEGVTERVDRSAAETEVKIQGRENTVTLRLPLHWERGVWVVVADRPTFVPR